MKNHEKLTIGMIVFPQLTMLDLIGPYDVFSKAPCFTIVTVSQTTEPIQAEGGLTFQAAFSFDDCPSLDIIFVPGGKGINPILHNNTYLNFIRQRGLHAQYITSVCTGSLLLAAAGLLEGYNATTHWRSMDLLRMFNVEAKEERVVIDRNRITGAGVTSGIDFGLTLISHIGGDAMAKRIQLMLEYDPQPPFQCGSKKTAATEVFEEAHRATQKVFDERVAIINSLLTK